MYVFTTAALAIIIVIIASYMTLMPLQKPINGPVIDKSTRKGAAVLVIDMQADFTGENGKQDWDNAYFEAHFDGINQTALNAQETGTPVIAMRMVYQGWYTNFLMGILAKGMGVVGSDGLQLDSRLNFTPDANFTKPLGDSFSSDALTDFLDKNQIGTLILVGLDGSYCLNTTAQSALARGYNVEIIDSAILAQDSEKWLSLRETLITNGAIAR